MFLHSQNPQPQTSANQSGFTIIESLVAILVVSTLLAAIAPVVGISVANRAQAKRTEQAINATKYYIEGLRSGEFPAPPISKIAPKDMEAFTVPKKFSCDKDSNISSPHQVCESKKTYDIFCINVDNDDQGCTTDSSSDLLIQAFGYHRNAPEDPSSLKDREKETWAEAGYQLGLRIYRANAFAEAGTLQIGTQSSTFAQSVANKTAPLLEMTTEVISDNTSYRDLCDRVVDDEGKSCDNL